MDYYLREKSFSPAPHPRRKYPTMKSHESNFLLTNNFNYINETLETTLERTREDCETPRTMPRKPRKSKFLLTQNTNSSEQSEFHRTIDRPTTSSSNYLNSSRLKRPNAPPPPLPIQSQATGMFESNLINSLPEYYNVNTEKSISKNSISEFSSSDYINSTLLSSNFSTPKMSRVDLLLPQSTSTSYSNLITTKSKKTFKITNDTHDHTHFNHYHIGFEKLETELFNVNHSLLRKQSNCRLVKYHPNKTTKKRRINNLFKKLKSISMPHLSFSNKQFFSFIVLIIGNYLINF